MDRRLAGSRPSWRRMVELCVMAGLAAGSVHVAWGAVMSPLPTGPSGPFTQYEVTKILPGLHAEPVPAIMPEALIARPLFSPSRRSPEISERVPEPEAPEPAAPPPPPVPPSYLVDGVMLFGETRKILLRHQPREPGQWLNQGDTTREGWTIMSIRANEIVLEQGGRSVAMSPRTRRVPE